MPRITVITVAWNAEQTIADTMASVAAQVDSDHEHLVIDGASTDRTLAVVKARATSATRIVSEPDSGLYDAMNKGLALARGEYVGFLNADDFFVRRDALALLQSLTRGEPAAVSAGVAIVRQDAPERWVRSYSATHFRKWMLRFGHMPPHPGFYVRRDLVTVLRGFDTRYRIGADFDFLVRFFAAGYRPASLAATLVAVREGGVSNRGFASRRRIAQEALAALRANGIRSSAFLVWMKYALKIAQYAIPPVAYPAPADVRFMR